MLVGYIRVSTQEQNTIRQEVLLESLGVEILFIDKASGKNAERPELIRMMEFVRQGDTIVVESISRFARNTRDLLELVERLTAKGVEFVSRKEAIDTTTPSGKFMLTIFGAVAELEREYILQRQKEGIAIAKANGIYKGRQPSACPDFDRVVTRRDHRRGSCPSLADQPQHILQKTERSEKVMTEMGFFVLGFTVTLAIVAVADAVAQTAVEAK